MLRIIAVLLVIPLVDALLLVALASSGLIGWQYLVLLVVLTALLGMLLVRAEGRHTLRKINEKVARGEAPTDELVDGGFLVAAGAFFLTPGLVTDALGLLLALPVTRYPIRVAVKKWVVTPYVDAKTDGFATGNVYIGGFPGGDSGAGGAGPGPNAGPGPDAGGGGRSDGGFDADDATDIDFEERDDG